MVRNESSLLSRFKFDLMIILALGCIGLGAWLNHHPISFESDDATQDGELPPQIGRADVLLVLPHHADNPERFEHLDFSFAWYNAMAQEIGPFNITLSNQLGPNQLHQLSLLVVPATSAILLDEAQITAIQRYVEEGGVLILEMPTPSWAALSGIALPLSINHNAKRITAAPTSPLQGELLQHLMDTPLNTRVMRIEALDSAAFQRADALLEIDGTPAHFHRALGEGHVFVVAFDFGMAITALQQGQPREDFSLVPPESEVERLDPDLLVLSDKMRRAAVPYADLLERHIFLSPLRYRPAPRLWLFPGTAPAALVLTHEERSFGDKAVFLADYEGHANFTSTYFVSATDMTNDGLDALSARHIDIGLGWLRSPQRSIYRAKGVGRLKPYQVALSLIEQKERLESWSGYTTRACKVIDAHWDNDYFATFRKLAHAGCRIDTTYGPQQEEDFGYLFGTGLPFLPIDRNGAPLPVYVVPTLVSDHTRFGPRDVDVLNKLMRDSRAGFHQLMVVNINADAMANDPHPRTLEQWLRAFDLATREQIFVTNLSEYMRFFSARRQSTLSSRFLRNERRLVVDLAVSPANARNGKDLLAPPALAVPTRFEGGAIDSVSIDGRLQERNLPLTGDAFLSLIRLPHGAKTVEVRWTGL